MNLSFFNKNFILVIFTKDRPIIIIDSISNIINITPNK